MRVQSGSVTDGPGVELPDPPQGDGGGATPDLSAFYGGGQPDYRAMLAQMMAQQPQQQQQQQQGQFFVFDFDQQQHKQQHKQSNL